MHKKACRKVVLVVKKEEGLFAFFEELYSFNCCDLLACYLIVGYFRNGFKLGMNRSLW
jgi:hypothetical protein